MKRHTLETIIREFLSAFPDGKEFKVAAHSLIKGEGGWESNDCWYLSKSADKNTVLEIARGRWQVFKANYAPKARVCDIQNICPLEMDRGFTLECNHIPFLDIYPN